jgi:regulatory protein spx
MVTLFTMTSCTSCKKARDWLGNHQIPYVERNLAKEPLTVDEIRSMITMHEDGLEGLISKRNQQYKELETALDDMTLTEAMTYLAEHPAILRRPMVTDWQKLQVGYHEEDIRMFLSRDFRDAEMRNAGLANVVNQ